MLRELKTPLLHRLHCFSKLVGTHSSRAVFPNFLLVSLYRPRKRGPIPMFRATRARPGQALEPLPERLRGAAAATEALEGQAAQLRRDLRQQGLETERQEGGDGENGAEAETDASFLSFFFWGGGGGTVAEGALEGS